MSTTTTELRDVPIAELLAHPENLRGDVDVDAGIKALAKSMQAVGQKQAATGRITKQGILLTAGHRRLAAARHAKLKTLRVEVSSNGATPDVETTQDDVLGMLAENSNREDLSTLATARGYAELREYGMTNAEIAATHSTSAAAVSRLVKLAGIDPMFEPFIDIVGIETWLALIDVWDKVPETPRVALISKLEGWQRIADEQNGYVHKHNPESDVRTVIGGVRRTEDRRRARQLCDKHELVLTTLTAEQKACKKGMTARRGNPVDWKGIPALKPGTKIVGEWAGKHTRETTLYTVVIAKGHNPEQYTPPDYQAENRKRRGYGMVRAARLNGAAAATRALNTQKDLDTLLAELQDARRLAIIRGDDDYRRLEMLEKAHEWWGVDLLLDDDGEPADIASNHDKVAEFITSTRGRSKIVLAELIRDAITKSVDEYDKDGVRPMPDWLADLAGDQIEAEVEEILDDASTLMNGEEPKAANDDD